jgi:two-component system, chemotaxis family, protein-glutamate methylesterase/glutaminase
MSMDANLSSVMIGGNAALFGGVGRLVDKCIAIGISTGGPPALAHLFAHLRPPVPPIVVVQHMPAAFTQPLAERLNGLSEITVCEATDGASLVPNQVLLAPGGKHLRIRRFGHLWRANVFDGPAVSSHKPSIDVLMTSVAEAFGRRCLGIIMTGMGRDGVAGCAAIRQAGGNVLGQDEHSSDVYGMNKIAFVEGHVDRQFALSDVADELAREIQTRWLGG